MTDIRCGNFKAGSKGVKKKEERKKKRLKDLTYDRFRVINKTTKKKRAHLKTKRNIKRT